MPDIFPIVLPNLRLRLPKDGPLIGWTRWSADGQSVLANVFATPDDSESDPAAGLLVSFLNSGGDRLLTAIARDQLKTDTEARAPYFSGTIEIKATDFKDGKIELEVLTLHAIAAAGKVFLAPEKEALVAGLAANSKAITGNYQSLRAELDERLQSANALLQDPKPASHSFEIRSNRSLEEARATLRLPLEKANTAAFKLIATTCRYPGFAFETGRVDEASYKKINLEQQGASGLLLLGDQIYADATASLFDNLTTIEKFQERYHALFRSPEFAKAVRTFPTFMTGDDHEFSNSWSKPDDALQQCLFKAARQSYGVYQISHSPFGADLDAPPYDYSFSLGPAGVYVMDTLSNRDTAIPGAETIVSDKQLANFETWLKDANTPEFVILATGGVVAPGFSAALDASGTTDVHRAQGLENWQAFNGQRIKLLDIMAACNKKVLLLAGDYHCAAEASIRANDGRQIAWAAVVPPAYAPMRYVNARSASLAALEQTGTYQISLVKETLSEGSGFAIVTIEKGAWKIKFDTQANSDI